MFVLRRQSTPPHATVAMFRADKGSAILATLLSATIAFLVILGSLWILDDSDQAPASEQATVQTSMRADRHPVPTDPLDAAVADDIATVRSFRDALTRELTASDFRPVASHRNNIEMNRRVAIQKMVSNSGRTGVNDRLNEIEGGDPGAFFRAQQSPKRSAIRQRCHPPYPRNRYLL